MVISKTFEICFVIWSIDWLYRQTITTQNHFLYTIIIYNISLNSNLTDTLHLPILFSLLI